MADTKPNKLLVAIDGSDRSILTVKYMSRMPAFINKEIHLFNVFASIPESYYDMGKEPSSLNITAGLYAWEQGQRRQIEKHMDKCRKILLASDVAPQRIKTVIHKRRNGVARDIIAESKNGYDAVVLRRRGMSKVQGLIMGSVALKLLDAITDTSLIFAGRKPCLHRVLVAVDGSENAMRAVDFTGAVLGGYEYAVGLVGVVRKGFSWSDEGESDAAPSHFEDAFEQQISNSLELAKERLINAGIQPEYISTEIIKGVDSRAEAIVMEAEQGNYDTIVVGRRGLSRVQQFFAGRVSTKILHIGRKHHVWIIR